MPLDVFEYLEEPEVNCFKCMKIDSIEDAAKEMLKRESNDDLYFAVVIKETGKVIGEIMASQESSNPDFSDREKDTFSPCWMLNRKYQGKGYAYEAAKAFF